MIKVNRGISIELVLTRRSMVLNGLHGSNCLCPCKTCASSDLLRLNSIRVVRVYPMRRMIKDLGGHAYIDPCFVEYDWMMRTKYILLHTAPSSSVHDDE